MRYEDQDGDAQQFLERDRRLQTTAAASADEQRLRATAAGLWRQLQRDWQDFTEGIAIDEASFSLNAVALGLHLDRATDGVSLEAESGSGLALNPNVGLARINVCDLGRCGIAAAPRRRFHKHRPASPIVEAKHATEIWVLGEKYREIRFGYSDGSIPVALARASPGGVNLRLSNVLEVHDRWALVLEVHRSTSATSESSAMSSAQPCGMRERSAVRSSGVQRETPIKASQR